MTNRTIGVIIGVLATLIIGGFALLLPRESSALPPTPPIPTIVSIPDDPQAVIRAYRQRGEYRQALYHLERWIARDGWDGTKHQLSADLWREMGNYAHSIPHLESIAEVEPSLNLLRQLAEEALQTNEWGEAYQWMEEMLVLSPENRWATFQTGILLAPLYPDEARNRLLRVRGGEDGNVAQTILDIFEQSGADIPVSATVGAVLASAGLWSQAEHAFLQASAEFYLFPEAMAYVGLMQAYQGKDGAAWIEFALRHNLNDNPNIYFVEGLYYRVIDDLERSQAALVFAITLEPDNPAYYAELGNTYRVMGDLDEAAYWLESAVALSGDDPALQILLDQFYEAEAYFLPPELLALLRPATFEADQSIALTAQGWTLHLAGDSGAGLAAIDQALALNPQNIRALYDKARILLETGRAAEAVPFLNEIAAGTSLYARDAARLLERIE